MPYEVVTPERRALVEKARSLRAQGLIQAAIAERMGVGRATAAELLNDPWRVKARLRRLRYQGVCGRCGDPTDGSSGPGASPEFCASCHRVLQMENARWTRGQIIAALWLWAAEHDGEHPSATEWKRSGSWHPVDSQVQVVFGKNGWGAAIEAAGWDRPKVGRKKQVKAEVGMMSGNRGYVILWEVKPDTWVKLGDFVESHSSTAALNLALDGKDPEPGRYVAVPLRHFDARELAPKTVYDWV